MGRKRKPTQSKEQQVSEQINTPEENQGVQSENMNFDQGSERFENEEQVNAFVKVNTPKVEHLAPAPEIKVGKVVAPNETKLGKEATEDTKKAISKESTAKVTVHQTPFEQLIEKIQKEGTQRERYVVTFMGQYVEAMNIKRPLDAEEGVKNQRALWRTMSNVVEQDDGFRECFRLIIAYFREYKDTVFHDYYVYRFQPEMNLAPDHNTGMLRLINLFKVAAGLNNKADIFRLVNMEATFSKGLTDSARNRVIQYFQN